jgi:hypothetical protein
MGTTIKTTQQKIMDELESIAAHARPISANVADRVDFIMLALFDLFSNYEAEKLRRDAAGDKPTCATDERAAILDLVEGLRDTFRDSADGLEALDYVANSISDRDAAGGGS